MKGIFYYLGLLQSDLYLLSFWKPAEPLGVRGLGPADSCAGSFSQIMSWQWGKVRQSLGSSKEVYMVWLR